MPPLDGPSANAFSFIREALLAGVIHGNAYHLPSPAETARKCPAVRNARTLAWQVELVDSAKVDASTCFGAVMLSAGYLCECWCAAHLMLKSALTQKLASDARLIQVLPRGETFAWPADAPLPTDLGTEYVAETNRMFSTIVTATVLHEIGHTIQKGFHPPGHSEEIACDRFAMKYLLGNRSSDGDEYRKLGVAMWLCGLCSEALTKEAYVSPTHPHPIDRMQDFLLRHASHPPRTKMEANLHLICASHVIKMARELRPKALDDSRFHDRTTFRGMLREIRKYW